LDPKLQTALKEYLMARGVNSELANSLREHLLQKERFQYVGWLKTMEGMLSKDH
jgi:complement component 1 Q subcomponent-binding protein